MKTKLNCPVCGYQEIEGKHCPNCHTDLSLIRQLQELAPIEKTSIKKNISNWTLFIGLLMLIIGIFLGAVGSYFFIKSQYHAAISAPNPTLVNNAETKTLSSDNIYIVKQGDNLGVIAEKVCGRASAWRLIAQANPHLETRTNYFLDVGEKLKIPNCQEKNK